jgi:ParB family transcriptional regulator, chromosome partitioning protein
MAAREKIRVDEIYVAASRRAAKEDDVARIARSIQQIGLQTPITVRMVERYIDPIEGELENVALLVAGRHRLEAAKSLGWECIDCEFKVWADDEARMWEIAENLHRADLTELERNEQIAEWIALSKKHGHCAQVSTGGRGNEGGVSKAARELGIERTEARRAVKVASLTEEAKDTARELGFDDNRSVLLAAKNAPDDVVFLRAEHERREAERRRKEAEAANRDTDRVIALTEAEQFANWLMERTDLTEMPTIISWLEGTKSKDVIAAMRRMAA